ncbi:thioredoxin family protein [Polyangium aurulentum]|uniref:thioredoxin family protein n=1 Tax=Polyangium aurulentum TaxID=2567896 RepID=UPI00146A705F|nr:thioredoxin family protein [Polyangium aurulentum]UQA57998.1 thioredoxin family protein [Polyangium aurulentum]
MQSLRSAARAISGRGGCAIVVAAIASFGCASGASSLPPAPVVAIADDREPRSRPANDGDAIAHRGKPARSTFAWETDERRARARARREGALLVVYLSAAWSAGSLAMEREVWSDPRILRHTAPLVALRIDLTDDGPDAELWVDRYGARAVPTTLVLDAAGREAARLEGQVSADEVLRALEKAADDDER